MKVSLLVTGEEILGLLSSSEVNDLWSGGAHLPYLSLIHTGRRTA